MRTYRRRRRLSAERSLHQVERGRLPQCPRCDHPAIVHAFDEAGQRVCTRGLGVVSCRSCAHGQAVIGEPARAMLDLAQALRMAGSRDAWKSFVLSP